MCTIYADTSVNDLNIRTDIKIVISVTLTMVWFVTQAGLSISETYGSPGIFIDKNRVSKIYAENTKNIM